MGNTPHTPAHTPVVETEGIGNRAANLKQVKFSSDHALPTLLGVRWDGDKVRGIRLEFNDGTHSQAGGYDDSRYTLTQYHFKSGEKLSKAWLRDSGYGYRSVRQIQFETSTGGKFNAGAGGFDNEISLAVGGAYLAGFHAWVNPDNFLNGVAFLVRRDAPTVAAPPPPWFETKPTGNPAAANHQVSTAAPIHIARYLAVRWDGDKIRGIRLEFNDGSVTSAGGIDDINYTLTSYTFAEGETLQSLSLSSSGYGYGSLRRFSFATNKGGGFSAGPQGIDDLVSPPAEGASIVGLHAWVNADNFINALAFQLTNDAPYTVQVHNFTHWPVRFENNSVIVNGHPVIHVADEGTNLHGMKTLHKRAISVTSGTNVGYCAYDGNAVLGISLFADGTFEAKFDVDYGDGVVYFPIASVAPSTSKLELLDALVHKYAPILMINVDEVYWPSNVDAFLQQMILQKVIENGVALNDFYTGTLTRDILAQQAALLGGNNTSNGACLRTRNDLNQPSDTQDWFNSAPPPNSTYLTTYAVLVEGSNGHVSIVFWWFFNYNQGKNVASTSWGNHVSDWEHVRVQLTGVDFSNPGHETLASVMYDHHGDQETHAPGDPAAEFSGRQVLIHMANGDHECYPKAGVYDRPQSTHDYCKENGYRYDQRQGVIEIYQWSGSNFLPVPQGAPATFKNPNWVSYRGRWGNWQRGDLFGQVARLESGPEGIFRAGEYPVP